MADNKVVIFVDVLGFASLTEAYPIESDFIEAYDRPLLWTIDTIFKGRDNPLTRTFTSFHRSLKAAIDLAKMWHPVTAISFSDSAFIATTHLFEAAKMAVYLLQSLLSQWVPVRIGIAHGSFTALRFRSDVTLSSGDHAAHFLGTGVVRSYTASTCGIKGLRLLLHPSAVPLLNDPIHNPVHPNKDRIPYLQCSKEEIDNNTGVQFEIDYWRFRPTAEVKAWHAFQDMWDKSTQDAIKQYQATAEAINRMRIGQGEPRLSNLRRRTLPHRKIRNT